VSDVFSRQLSTTGVTSNDNIQRHRHREDGGKLEIEGRDDVTVTVFSRLSHDDGERINDGNGKERC